MIPALYIIDSPEKRERLSKRILALPVDGEIWDVRIKLWEPIRSLEQNARLHLIFHRVAQATGNDLESVKLGYKRMFLPSVASTVFGRRIEVYPKTSKMNKAQLREFMDQVEAHAISEFGIVLGENEYAYG